jgi:hypothetical protein
LRQDQQWFNVDWIRGTTKKFSLRGMSQIIHDGAMVAHKFHRPARETVERRKNESAREIKTLLTNRGNCPTRQLSHNSNRFTGLGDSLSDSGVDFPNVFDISEVCLLTFKQLHIMGGSRLVDFLATWRMAKRGQGNGQRATNNAWQTSEILYQSRLGGRKGSNAMGTGHYHACAIEEVVIYLADGHLPQYDLRLVGPRFSTGSI